MWMLCVLCVLCVLRIVWVLFTMCVGDLYVLCIAFVCEMHLYYESCAYVNFIMRKCVWTARVLHISYYNLRTPPLQISLLEFRARRSGRRRASVNPSHKDSCSAFYKENWKARSGPEDVVFIDKVSGGNVYSDLLPHIMQYIFIFFSSTLKRKRLRPRGILYVFAAAHVNWRISDIYAFFKDILYTLNRVLYFPPVLY